MLHKNLRSLLYYVAGVTAVCLMIEVSKRNQDGKQLDPLLYTVVEDKGGVDSRPATAAKDEEEEEVIPRRNRGRPGTKDDQADNMVEEMSDRDQFKQWKASMKISPDEVGLFKKWKQEMGRGKKQLKAQKEEMEEADEDDKEDDEEEEEEEDEEETPKAKPIREEDVDEGYDTPEEEEEKEEKEEDYPGGVTEYDPPDSQHSCTDLTMTDRLLERANSVAAACDRLEDELGDQRRLYSRLRWAVPERLLYCPVFKAASTSWLINYLKLSNSTTDPKSGNLHTKITNLFPAPATHKLRKRIFEESTKFIIVRHPFERLVSAYRDKLAGFSRNPHYLSMRKHIIEKYRKSKKSKSAIPTFRESFDFVVAELEKMENTRGKGRVLIDGHFMPYSRRCLPCTMKYDVVIKFETLEEDSRYLIEQCGLSGRLEVLHENPAPTGPETDQGTKNKSKKVRKGQQKAKIANSDTKAALDFFRDIPKSKIRQLYEHYRHDFEIFGYSAEEYLEMEES